MMLRQLVVESGIVLTLTTLLLALAATVGLPGRPEASRAAADETATATSQGSGTGGYHVVTGFHFRLD